MTHRGQVVLVVDDEPDIRELLAAALRRARPHLKVVIAESAIEALQVMEEQHVDVVVSDHRMAGMSGIELLEVIQERSPPTLSILMTAYSDLALILRSARCPRVARFVTKPFPLDQMVRVIGEVLEESVVAVEAQRAAAAGT